MNKTNETANGQDGSHEQAVVRVCSIYKYLGTETGNKPILEILQVDAVCASAGRLISKTEGDCCRVS